MKKIMYSMLFISLFSCTSDDENTNDNDDDQNLAATTYFNLTTNNFWKYRVETKNGTAATVVESNLDHLKVGTEVVQNGIVYKNMEAVGSATGFYTGVMDEKKLRKISDRLEFTGNITLELGNGLPAQSIPVENFIIFKESAANGTILNSRTGTLAPIPVVIPYNGVNQNVNVTVEYALSTVAGVTYSSFTAPTPNSGIAATTYDNVKAVKLVLNIKASTNIGGITLNLLNPQNQDFIVSTNYYAKDKGVVYTETKTKLTFSSLVNFPAIDILQREYLVDFLNN